LIISTASEYINFGAATQGGGGYGLRDNAGVMEFKSSGGAWTTFVSLSDARLKQGIEDYSLGLDFVMQLQPKQFAWAQKDKNYGDRKQVGLIAQDVKKVIDELGVDFGGWIEHGDERQTQSLDYNQLTVVLVNAIKELKREIDLLKGETFHGSNHH
jgi:hypothetical protein